MTGYGRAEGSLGKQTEQLCSVEIRAVNGRFLEISCRLPKTLNHLEYSLRSLLKKRLKRGSVSLYINLENAENNQESVVFNRKLVQRYLDTARQIQTEYEIPGQVDLQQILLIPDLFSTSLESQDLKQIEAQLIHLVQQALETFETMRIAEGANLALDLNDRIARLNTILTQIETLDPQRIENWKNKFQTRMQELLGDNTLEPMRIAQEASVIADKLDISEEITRFRSHNQLFVKALQEDSNQGKKLNFILQEMGREANTLGTKCQNADIAQLAISLKDEIESIREQVQNIE